MTNEKLKRASAAFRKLLCAALYFIAAFLVAIAIFLAVASLRWILNHPWVAVVAVVLCVIARLIHISRESSKDLEDLRELFYE